MYTMSLIGMLPTKDIDKAYRMRLTVLPYYANFLLDTSGNLFEYKKFLRKVGVSKESAVQIRKIYDILDTNKSGFIEIDDVGVMLSVFKPGARKLTAAETADFMKAGDPNNTGKISPDAERSGPNLRQQCQELMRGTRISPLPIDQSHPSIDTFHAIHPSSICLTLVLNLPATVFSQDIESELDLNTRSPRNFELPPEVLKEGQMTPLWDF
ncbi:unnamed protein product [Ranitomeya imitator]|uniref:Parvalbumin n=1 Tax=Ranitomeya imitator TaxID=111125 RepID=A0ABN9MRH3_9NEOB|nr:unnamed protein product [Ranitomeya imitator]